MFWKQFFTPVDSIDAGEAKKMIDEHPQDALTILDVRQPKEYENRHIPGARLIPLPELKDRLHELDPDKTTIAYCAVGGRSRVAAQMLAGRGFREVYNLSGGMKAWDGLVARGPVDQGLELFSGNEDVEDVIITAYSLEKGLRDFYQQMIPMVDAPPVKEVFHKLFGIEINHQNRLLSEYNRLTGKSFANADFDREIAAPAMEGGLTTEEYLELFKPNLDSPAEVIDLAMSIEAQALDMYQRASENTKDPESSKVLQQLALEEQEHLKQLGSLFEKL